MLDCWDILYNHSVPVLQVKIADHPLYCIKLDPVRDTIFISSNMFAVSIVYFSRRVNSWVSGPGTAPRWWAPSATASWTTTRWRGATPMTCSRGSYVDTNTLLSILYNNLCRYILYCNLQGNSERENTGESEEDLEN